MASDNAQHQWPTLALWVPGGGMERRGATACAGWLGTLDVEIHHDRVLTASYDDGLTGFVGESVDLLVRHIRRNIDEVAGSCFTAEFQVVSPSHASSAANNVEDGFELAVLVRAGLSVRLNYHRAGPQFAGSRSGVGDGGGASHAGSLGRVGVQISGWNDLNAVVLPVHDLHDNRFSSTVPNSHWFQRCSRTVGPRCAGGAHRGQWCPRWRGRAQSQTSPMVLRPESRYDRSASDRPRIASFQGLRLGGIARQKYGTTNQSGGSSSREWPRAIKRTASGRIEDTTAREPETMINHGLTPCIFRNRAARRAYSH